MGRAKPILSHSKKKEMKNFWGTQKRNTRDTRGMLMYGDELLADTVVSSFIKYTDD